MESDAEVIARSVAHPAAFEALFDRYFFEVHRFLLNRLDQAAVAEELAAETFLRAFAARGRYRACGAGARAWLFAIAMNLLRDEARARARRRSLIDRLGRHPQVAELPEHGPDPVLR